MGFRYAVIICNFFIVPQKILFFLQNIWNGLKYRFQKFSELSKRRRKQDIEKKAVLGVFKKKRFPHISQILYLPRFLSNKEKTALIFFGSLATISFLGILSLLYLNSTKISPASGGEYAEGIVGYPHLINPFYSQANEVDKDLASLVYSGLMTRNARGVIVPDLAESYKVSDDEKTYIFTLRSNALWSDGKPVSADDVIFTIDAIKNEKYQSPLRSTWAEVSVKKINEQTVQFQLSKAYGSFLSLATLGILPKHIWEHVPVATIYQADANLKPVGSGPYNFLSFVKDKVGVIKSYTVERNEKYYEKKPNIKTITLKFYPDYISAANALDNHQVDGLAYVPAEARSVLKLKSRLESYDIILPQFNAIFLNAKENDILKDKTVRKALAMAIDRKKIIDNVLSGDGELIEGPILYGYPGYDDKINHSYYDKEAAKNLLVQAGWVLKDGNAIRANKKKTPLKIILTTVDKTQNAEAAKIIQESWKSIGADVELNVVAAANIAKDVIDGRKYQALLFGEMYGPDLDPYSYWHSSAIRYPGLNLAQYSNAKVDMLLEAARQTLDKVVRQKKYEEFQSLLLEDFPTIFLWQPKYAYLIDARIKGVEISALYTPSDRWKNIMAGYISTKRTLK